MIDGSSSVVFHALELFHQLRGLLFIRYSAIALNSTNLRQSAAFQLGRLLIASAFVTGWAPVRSHHAVRSRLPVNTLRAWLSGCHE